MFEVTDMLTTWFDHYTIVYVFKHRFVPLNMYNYLSVKMIFKTISF
jgi:hypothetical protein